MNTTLLALMKKLTALSYLFGIASLIVGISAAAVQLPVRAASAEETPTSEAPTPESLACTPPGDWDRTVRLYYKSRTQKDWTFEVEEPQMDVTLQFFYYQDYDRYGCPFDCSTGACQTVEIGEGESPFGSFSVADGQEGASDGIVRQSGKLTQGTYTASFWVTGAGSINIGLKVHKRTVPTETTVPPNPATLPPTPAETELPPVATATSTEGVLPPVPAATDTPSTTEVIPPATEVVPTTTPVEGTNPPIDVVTATPTQGNPVQPPAKTKTPKPPATLPPPSAPTAAGNPPALVPETGADLASLNMGETLGKNLFLKLGLTLVGIALVLQGINHRNRPR